MLLTSGTEKIKMTNAILPLLKLLKVTGWILPPITGMTSFGIIMQIANTPDKNWIWIALIATAISTSITVIVNAIVKVKLGNKELGIREIQTTQTGEVEGAALVLQIFDKGMSENEKQRAHFTETIKELTTTYERWKIENRTHYEDRFDDLRQEKHDKEKELTEEVQHLRLFKAIIKDKLKERGIVITDGLDLMGTWKDVGGR